MEQYYESGLMIWKTQVVLTWKVNESNSQKKKKFKLFRSKNTTAVFRKKSGI